MARPKRREQTPIRITTASAGARADIASRQKRYVITMGIRTVCVVACIFTPGWWLLIPALGAIVLPYVAVVMANAANTKSDGFELRDGSSRDRQLTPRSDSE